MRLYKRVTLLSEILNREGNRIAKWALTDSVNRSARYEPLNRRRPLPENLKIWREALYRAVQSSTGLYPSNLGKQLTHDAVFPQNDTQETGHWVNKANWLLETLPKEWRPLMGDEFKFNSDMMVEFTEWLEEGDIYGGSDGSVINGIGAHSFVITNAQRETTMWGGAATTPGSIEEMASQRAEHAGSIAVLIMLHILQ